MIENRVNIFGNTVTSLRGKDQKMSREKMKREEVLNRLGFYRVGEECMIYS